MTDRNVPLATLAGGVGAGLGTTVPMIFEFDGTVALLTALGAGAMTGGLFLFVTSTVSDRDL